MARMVVIDPGPGLARRSVSKEGWHLVNETTAEAFMAAAKDKDD